MSPQLCKCSTHNLHDHNVKSHKVELKEEKCFVGTIGKILSYKKLLGGMVGYPTMLGEHKKLSKNL